MRAKTFAVVANGFADGPAQALRDYLVERGDNVFAIAHPLAREEGRRHLVTRYAGGRLVDERAWRAPVRAPLSFALDPLIPPVPPRVDVWFGFNPLACARGLVARRQNRARHVFLWSVDFVPDRFGPGSPATRLYDRLDRLCCLRADARIELSEAALRARETRHNLPAENVPAYVVPMGAWLDRVTTTPEDGFKSRRIVYLGHLVPRQGVDLLLEALALLQARGEQVEADVIGTGPLEEELRLRARELNLEALKFHGFVPDHRDVERILAGASVAAAPYAPTDDNFTRYADPGKLKAYLAAGLPIILTAVPPNAGELEREAGAQIVAYDRVALADALSAALVSAETWRVRRGQALGYARRFDWDTLLPDLLLKLGL